MRGCQDHYDKIDVSCPECARFLEPPLTVAALRSRVAELEAALRPFGNAYRFTKKLGSMRPEYEASMTCTGEFTVADLHRAAELTADK